MQTGNNISHQERLARVQLAFSANIGPATYVQLMEVYGSAENALLALPDLASRANTDRRIRLQSASQASRIHEETCASGGSIITLGEPDYPLLLAESAGAPPVLFVLGKSEILQSPCCGIVGSRNSSANGKRITREIAAGLAYAGWRVVSGLARGIDTAAHQASLDSQTIAVIATGLNAYYPPENMDLQQKIAETGCVVTEMPPGTQPRAELFPRRNRIIAGLSSGIVVVEAALRSGSLITARLANENGRDVFAVPGSPYDPRSQGTNRLIREGATLVTCVEEILEMLSGQTSYLTGQSLNATIREDGRDHKFSVQPPDPRIEDAERNTVVSLMGPDPVEVDLLIRESGMPSRMVQMVLIELDLQGKLERHPGQCVSLLR